MEMLRNPNKLNMIDGKRYDKNCGNVLKFLVRIVESLREKMILFSYCYGKEMLLYFIIDISLVTQVGMMWASITEI